MAADAVTEEQAGHATPIDLKAKAVRGAEREISKPYLQRQDVGTLSFMVGNWAGNRANQDLDKHQTRDMKSTAGAIMLLQEATKDLANSLRQPGGSVASASTATVHEEDTHDCGGNDLATDQRLDGNHERAWLCIVGHEHGKTNVVACRANMAERVRLLLWRRRCDGQYMD